VSLPVREHLLDLPAYTAAKRPGPGGVPVARLAANESPFAPLGGVVDALVDGLVDVNRYPDSHSTVLRERLGRHYRLSAEQFVVSTGSVALIGHLLGMVVGPGGEVVYPWRSFEAYPIFARLAAGNGIAVPLQEDRADLDEVLRRVGPRTRAVVLCNPNNPTGTLLDQGAIRDFCAAVPDDVLVVIDEAYAEFAADDRIADVDLVTGHRNVCVLRTFSKAYGLAALRIGYAVTDEPFAEQLRRAAVPFAANALGQAAALAALDCGDELRERLGRIRVERDRVTEALRRLGLEVPTSAANFVWAAVGAATPELARHCEASGVHIRPFADDGCRITIGRPDDNDRMLEAVTAWVAARP
jgi:histidinol-phosphate aminotransferase